MDAIKNRLSTPTYNPQSNAQRNAPTYKSQNNELAANPSFGKTKDLFWINAMIDKLVGKFPNDITIKENSLTEKAINGCENFSSHNQRLFLGATAIATQPLIDLNNKDTDEKTRKISACRTAAKIIAGTATGFFIRWGCIEGIKFCTETDPKKIVNIKSPLKKALATALVPNKADGKSLAPEAFEKAFRLVKKHRNALGTCIALVVMLFTNFLLDVPITKFLTNLFVDKFVDPNQAKGGK